MCIFLYKNSYLPYLSELRNKNLGSYRKLSEDINNILIRRINLVILTDKNEYINIDIVTVINNFS